jgi:hypothetical protein
MIRSFFLLIVVFGTILFLVRCTADELPEPSKGDCDGNLEVSFATDIRPIIDNSCAYSGCHQGGGGAPGDYSSYGGLKGVLDSGTFQQRVFDLRGDEVVGMPPNYAPNGRPTDLTSEEINLLQCWVENGYPEN